jgi:hypothetical protein
MVYAWREIKRELKQELHLSSEEFEHLVHPATAPTAPPPPASATTSLAITAASTAALTVEGEGHGHHRHGSAAFTRSTGPAGDLSIGHDVTTYGIDTTGNAAARLDHNNNNNNEPTPSSLNFDFQLHQGDDEYGIEAGIYRDDDEKWYWVWT